MLENFYAISELINKNEIKGPDPLCGVAEVSITNGQLHYPGLCGVSGGKTNLTLKEVIEGNCQHYCMDYLPFFYDDGSKINSDDMLLALQMSVDSPRWDEIKAFTDIDGANAFTQALHPLFSQFTRPPFILPPVFSQWLHQNKGYPLDPEEIFDTYDNQLEELLEALLPSVMIAYANHYRVDVNFKFPSDPLEVKALHQAELDSPVRAICLGKSNKLEVARYLWPFDMKLSVVRLAIKKFSPGSLTSLCLTPSLATVTNLAGLTRGSVEVKESLTAEELKTLEVLVNQGLSLEEALTSVSYLK